MERDSSVGAHGESPAAAEKRQFGLTYRNHRAFVCRLVRRFGIPSRDVDDATQEVFIILYQKFPGLIAPDGVQKLLYAVTLRVCSNRRRSSSRRARTLVSSGADTDICVPDRALAPDEQAALHQQRELLLSALSRLDESKREVFILSELRCLSATEIAALVHISPNTVASRLRAARRRVTSRVQGHRKRHF